MPSGKINKNLKIDKNKRTPLQLDKASTEVRRSRGTLVSVTGKTGWGRIPGGNQTVRVIFIFSNAL